MLIKFIAAALAVGVFMAIDTGAQSGPASTSGYAWASSCAKCHETEYTSWEKTKHAAALERLSSAEQEKDCIGCHVTGPKGKVVENGRFVNKGVQCEACHGAAAAHVADPTVKTGLVAKPPSSTCETCHNDKGPHFKGFWYDAMKGLVHAKAQPK
jgi:hypothetical protein